MTTTTTRTRRPNTYAGVCSDCGGHVPAQAGQLGPKVAGRWTVAHAACPTMSITSTAPARRTVRRNQPSTERCYYGHTAPVAHCLSCFDDFS